MATKEENRAKDQAKRQAEAITTWHAAFLFCDSEGQDISVLPAGVQSFLKEEMDWDSEEPEHEDICDAIREMGTGLTLSLRPCEASLRGSLPLANSNPRPP